MAWKSTCYSYRRRFFSLLLLLSSFTLSNAQTIFQPTDVPAVPLTNDGQPLEIGVKFRAVRNGYITGIRYYKGAGTTGTHIGQLWSNTGELLASASFSNETSSGWQQVSFSTPLAITSGITYVAACYSPSGDYAITKSFFTQGITNGPLYALGNGEDGPNGVFIFSQVPMFPSSGFQASNYWVDVVFTENSGPDVDPPIITTVSPYDGAMNVSLTTSVTAIFNEAMDASTINNSTFELRDAANQLIPCAISYSATNHTITLTLSAPLDNSAVYDACIRGGDEGVKDVSGNALEKDYGWTFTSVDPAFLPPTEGYGGPILVVNNAANPLSRYAAEILRAEGLNEFAAKDISSLTAADLTSYDVVILGEGDVTPDQVAMLKEWISAGGTLIAFRPNALLAPLFGISAANGTMADKYLLINTNEGPGFGIVNQSIQYHGNANLHSLNGATSIASLYSDANTATAYPAVTMMRVGSNGGRAIAFTYDLAKSIVYTRQGNPAWAGQKRDGQAGPIRSDDLFYPDWIDFNKITIPQADEQQRLLANIIIQSNFHRKPLPRLWYLPKMLRAAIVMTGDDHANNGTTGRFNQYMSLGPNTPQDVADWRAIRATSYIYSNTPITNTQAVAFESQGFEIALHPSTLCENFTVASLENDFNSQLASFASALPGVSPPATNRTHCMPWSDWSTHSQTEFNHGIRMDVNYYYWPESWIQNRPGMFTGSGLPMRFTDINGNMIDCYQATTQMTDESGINIPDFCNTLLDKATGPEGYYGTFVANMHTDAASHPGSDAIIASAMAHKVPVISAKQLLRWTDGRNNTSFGAITWSDYRLRFTVAAPSGARNLDCMLPLYAGDRQLISLSRNGYNLPFITETIKGMQYAFFDVPLGTTRYEAYYGILPVVTLHPSSQKICTGNRVSFSSAATGDPLPAVQWQESVNGTTWTNIAAADSSTLSFVPTTADNNKKYRAVWTSISGVVYSNAAILIINALPELISTSTPSPVVSGTVFGYVPESDIEGTSFEWKREAVAGISNPATSGSGKISEVLINTTNTAIEVAYVYKLTANGCASTQKVVVRVDPAPEGCSINTAITANFNSIPIPSGRYIWFNSIFNPANIGNRTVNVTISGARITYMINNQQVTLIVPDAHIRFSPSITAPVTRFTNNKWETEVPAGNGGNVFMTGLSYPVAVSLPGGIKNVKWSMIVAVDKSDVSLEWKWTAGVYTKFAGHGDLNIKPVDGLLNLVSPLLNTGNAGTPLNYTLYVVAGAMGTGLVNITSTYSATSSVACTNTNVDAITARSVQQVQSTTTSTFDQELDVKLMPNPANEYFNLVINGKKDKPVTIRVWDISGRLVETREMLATNTSLRIGHGWGVGSYIAEIIQGEDRKMIKMMKVQ